MPIQNKPPGFVTNCLVTLVSCDTYNVYVHYPDYNRPVKYAGCVIGEPVPLEHNIDSEDLKRMGYIGIYERFIAVGE